MPPQKPREDWTSPLTEIYQIEMLSEDDGDDWELDHFEVILEGNDSEWEDWRYLKYLRAKIRVYNEVEGSKSFLYNYKDAN